MWGGWFLKHFAEYKLLLAPNASKEGGKSLTGVELTDTTMTDVMGKADQMGHRIRATMKGSSLGPKNRRAEFTFDYTRGVINKHEDAFLLGTTRGILDRPNQTSYVLTDYPAPGKEMKWVGKADCIMGLQRNEDVCKTILERVKMQDIDLMEKGASSKFYRVEETQDEEEASKEE